MTTRMTDAEADVELIARLNAEGRLADPAKAIRFLVEYDDDDPEPASETPKGSHEGSDR